MPFSDDPDEATSIIAFVRSPSGASKLNHNVRVPGKVRNRRIIKLDGLLDDASYTADAKPASPSISDAGFDQNTNTLVDETAASSYGYRAALAGGIRADVVSKAQSRARTDSDTGLQPLSVNQARDIGSVGLSLLGGLPGTLTLRDTEIVAQAQALGAMEYECITRSKPARSCCLSPMRTGLRLAALRPLNKPTGLSPLGGPVSI